MLRVCRRVNLGAGSVPFIGASNVWVDDSLTDSSSIAFVQFLTAAAIQGTAAGQLEVIVYDDALSGMASPFQDINNGGEKILRVVNDSKELSQILRYLRGHIQGVQNVIQGRTPSLTEFRDDVQFPIEGYKLVVLATDFGLLDEAIQNEVVTLSKVGPQNGVTFLIHSMDLGVNEYILDLFERLNVNGNVVRSAGGHVLGNFAPENAQSLIATARRISAEVARQSVAVVPFSDIEPADETWRYSSAEGITFTIGRYGLAPISITLGDEVNQRHNALITGAVGQGKSNLISVIVHSLCGRYSPEELQLYLLDFKEGVTLQRFAGEGNGEFLPHARVIGLEADREFGLSVLQHLFAVYVERMRTFKSVGVQSIREYRRVPRSVAMPRILLIVDEFQMMFAERDRVSDEIADLLQKAVRLFRAAGIHIILASQTIGGNASLMGAAAEGLFGQVPVRIALKNSLAESHATLGANNSAASYLRSREAVVNLDYGEPAANKKIAIAFADEAVLKPRRHEWLSLFQGQRRPYVFRGEEARSLVDDWGLAEHTVHEDSLPTAWIGQQLDVDGTCVQADMSRGLGRNIALVGPTDAVVPLLSIVTSLVLTARKDCPPEVAILDLSNSMHDTVGDDENWVEDLRSCGAVVHAIDGSGVEVYLEELIRTVSSGGAGEREVYVVGIGMERLRSSATFESLIAEGPLRGIHFVCWWSKFGAFQDLVGFGGAAHFDVKLGYGLDRQSARRLFDDPLLEWSPRDNRMLAWDALGMSQPCAIIPYTAAPSFEQLCSGI
ncbi:FtsK/SpoIIIE domain-containing protein [Actinomyces qiguomingii]|uniref:FtsK/SpoIIIE domain-containing protein n=1 Tax=Actinomyces qiguomingii TaxID=2057800 RepID=UPI000CA05F24|nr:FtsK/SpoIIIE domain-containing protein [Actinomyces qiguomingii]